MSVRHKVRERVEKLFSNFKDLEGEFVIYNIYAPTGNQEIEAEDLNYVDIKVNFNDSESIKKFLDRTTRETLENEVKGYYLLGMVLDKGNQYIPSSDIDLLKEMFDDVKEVLERLKEE